MGHQRRARYQKNGQVIIVFALVMSLVLFWLFCAVVDLDYIFNDSTLAQAAAQTAATSGANDINPNYLYTNISTQLLCTAALCGQSAAAACDESGNYSMQLGSPPPPGNGTNCDQDPVVGCYVRATTQLVVRLPLPLPGFPDTVDVDGQFSAVVTIGQTTGTEQAVAGCVIPPTFPPPP